VFSAGPPQESQNLKTPPHHPMATTGSNSQYATLLKLFILIEFDFAVATRVTQTSISSMEYPTANPIPVFHEPEKSVASQLFCSGLVPMLQKPRRNRHNSPI
jgi:hypothetical protein